MDTQAEKEHAKPRIKWYRCPLDRDALKRLSRKSDVKGSLQAGGHLLLLAITGTCSWVAAEYLAWPWALLVIFCHGTCFGFLNNGIHELVHETVFQTNGLNKLFMWVYSFLVWFNPLFYWSSHTEHHKYTLHPPDDLEVTLPVPVNRKDFLLRAFVDLRYLLAVVGCYVRLAFTGRLVKRWHLALYPDNQPQKRRPMIRWARILLGGHAIILVVSIVLKLWLLPLLITLAPFYGRWLYYLCNQTQHVGLVDSVTDFRLCCRTIKLNPFFQFLYWHMNYHTEHHMYASIPCYNLGKLHRQIKHDLPPTLGLVGAWKQIGETHKRQKSDPAYHYFQPLPNPAPQGFQHDANSNNG